MSPAALDSPWLTESGNGALDFWAPANGARIGISEHARTELRGTGTFVLGHGSANGLWLPVQKSDGTWQFKNQNSGLYLGQPSTAATQGVQFEQSACASGLAANQDFATQ
ncbi:MAG TPA: hypothetical protein VFN97_20575 [Actinospica sp.]|nr:hypothetical protein [Actinospica sp.]